MFLTRKPPEWMIREFLLRQAKCEFSYTEIGASRSSVPKGYTVDHNRLKLGAGQLVFEAAQQALRNWEMFHLGWLELCWPNVGIEEETVVAVLIHHWSFWSLNACRIVYIKEEKGSVERYGFAYGTLPDHSECGEERFTVEWHRDDDSVWYDLFAFSKPNHWLAKIGYPLSRHLQKRFAEDSKEAMLRAVKVIAV